MDKNGVNPWSWLAPGGARKAEIWQTSDETAVLAWRPAAGAGRSSSGRWLVFRSSSHAAILSMRVCLPGLRRWRHCDARTASSDSAISSQLPCFGVFCHSKRSTRRLALSCGKASYNDAGLWALSGALRTPPARGESCTGWRQAGTCFPDEAMYFRQPSARSRQAGHEPQPWPQSCLIARSPR
jgi:hypothetical protein